MPRLRLSTASVALAWLLAATAALPLAAQPGRGGATPRARMDEFLAALWTLHLDSAAPFFPRRGEWSWVMTAHHDGKPDRVGVHRFAAGETMRAISRGGPMCESFVPPGDTGYPNSLMTLAVEHERGWRRVRGNRFVPPGAPAHSPAFVEWRREDGAWVISAIGDERHFGPRVLGVLTLTVVPDGPRTPPSPAGPAYAAGAEWFEKHRPLHFRGMHFVKYGLPRVLADSQVVRFGAVGGVAVFREAGTEGWPEVMYLAVSPGTYQPYNGFGTTDCRRPD